MNDPNTINSMTHLLGDAGWDDVLEYRVWGPAEPGSMESEIGSDYYFAFVTNADANECSDPAPKPLESSPDKAK